jgi:hypothetical protein
MWETIPSVHDFAVLSTVGEDARPASADVTYGVSPLVHDLALHVP